MNSIMNNYKIALLGIDGAGKSTMSKIIKEHLIFMGYNVTIIPFHKWVIADKLRNIFGKVLDKGRKDRKSQYIPPRKSFAALIKPPIAFIDNILFYKINSPKQKNEVFIYDRFICATQIKFAGLGYVNNWFKKIWWSYKPGLAIVFDVDVEESERRQLSRNDPYIYTKEVLSKEKKLYLQYAKNHNFPIIKSSDLEANKKEVLRIVNFYFKQSTDK